jgi:hypothetical protein
MTEIKNRKMKKTIYHSPLGAITILTDDTAIYGLWFNDQKYYGGHYQLDSIENGMTLQAKKAAAWLDQFFAGQNPSLAGLKLAPKATGAGNWQRHCSQSASLADPLPPHYWQRWLSDWLRWRTKTQASPA